MRGWGSSSAWWQWETRSSLCSRRIERLKNLCRLKQKVNVNITDFCPAIKATQPYWGSEFTFFTEAQCVIIYV